MPYLVLISCVLAGVRIASALPAMRPLLGAALAVALALFAGLRAWSVDYDDYLLLLGLMEQAQDIDLPWRWFVGKDPLYGVLLWWSAVAQWPLQRLFFVSALLSLGVKWLAFQHLHLNVPDALLVTLLAYFFLHEFTQVGVGIAVGWAFWALAELLRRRWALGLLLMAIAAGFHASALLLLPFLLLLAGGAGVWAQPSRWHLRCPYCCCCWVTCLGVANPTAVRQAWAGSRGPSPCCVLPL